MSEKLKSVSIKNTDLENNREQRSTDITDGLPNLAAGEEEIQLLCSRQNKPLYVSVSNINFERIKSAFGTVLHMHQPTIPASTDDLKNAELISNLQYMLEHQNLGDNHNATVFLQCYQRMADFIRELVNDGCNPRVMLDYSGNLLWGLRQINNGEALEKLKLITCDKRYFPHLEWLGTMWSHAVATSTPVPDIKLHLLAWRKHFASIFGKEALSRIKGFSPPEMHLPIHPDACFAYIKALKECGYEWLAVQEHTIETLDGSRIHNPYLPHRLVAKNSLGETEEIAVLIKTQGSDTKLIAQMQPYYEAKTKSRQMCGGKETPSYVFQVGDGENGGVMMNEFPQAYKKAFYEMKNDPDTARGERSRTTAMNGSEYLEFLKGEGIDVKSFTPVQPINQKRIWDLLSAYSQGAADIAIKKVHEKDAGFNLDKGSWTNDRNWVKDYENVLSPINKLSVMFHRKFDGRKTDPQNPAYRKALVYLLLSQSSDFRYWGQGLWTDYAKEICRRGLEILER